MAITDLQQPVPEPTDPAQSRSDSLLTFDQRKQIYRSRLVEGRRGKGFRLKRFLQIKKEYFRGLDQLARRKRAEDIDLMHRYFNGDQYGAYNEMGGYEDRRQDGDFAYSIPMLNGHVEQAFLQIFKTRPQYEFEPDDSGDPNMVQVAKLCETTGVKQLNKVLETGRQFEIYNLLLAGESPRYVYWAPNPKAPRMAKRAKYQREEFAIGGGRRCEACGNTEIPEGQKDCPKCGATYIKDVPGSKAMRFKIAEENEVMLGENRLHIPHPLAMQRDMSALTWEDSTFLIERSYLDKHVAAYKYQSIIEDTGEGLSIEMQMRYDLERSSIQTDGIVGSARAGVSGPGREPFGGDLSNVPMNKVEQEREFLHPSEYGQFFCDMEEVLPNGKKIPAGTLLGDYFPRGMYVVWVGNTVLDVDEWISGRKWSLLQYGKTAGTNAGAGLKKLISLQDVINDDFNMGHKIKTTLGNPLTVIRGDAVYELPGAGQILKINKAGVDDVQKLVAQFPGQSMNNADQTQELANRCMQFIAGTNTIGAFDAGAPDMRAAGTAHGIAAMQEQAAGRQMGPVDQMVLADKETLWQILENIQEYCTEEKSPEQYGELVKRWGPDVAQAFFQCNLRQSLTITVAANTDIPRSMALSQANQVAFGQIAGELLKVAADVPWVMEFLSSLADAMGIPFKIGEGRSDRREAEFRLNKLSAIEVQITQKKPMLMGNPEAAALIMYKALAEFCDPLIQEAAPVSEPTADGMQPEPQGVDEVNTPRIFLQNHVVFMDVYKDALFSEEAKSWNPARKLVVIQLWLDHFKAKISEQGEMAQLQAELNAQMNPQPPAPDPEQIAALQEEERQKQLQDAQLQRQADEEGKDAQLTRDVAKDVTKAELQDAAAEADHERAQELQVQAKEKPTDE